MLTNRIKKDTSYLVQKSDTAHMLSNRFARDTVSLSERINLKLNIADTATMLTNRIKKDTSYLLQKADTITLSNRINRKINIADTSAMLTNRIMRDTSYLLQKADTITLSNRIDAKVNIEDTSLMLNNRFKRDTVSLSDRISVVARAIFGTSGDPTSGALYIADTAAMLNNRINYDTSFLVQKADTAAMLSSRFERDTASLSNRIQAIIGATLISNGLKLDMADTIYMSNRIIADSITLSNKLRSDSTKINTSLIDSARTLNSRINLKLNIADTADMLTNRIKYDTSFLLQKNDTITLSKRIDALNSSTGGALSDSTKYLRNKIYTDSLAIATKLRSDSTKINTSLVDSTAALNSRINSLTATTTAGKVSVTDTAAMLAPYARKFTKDFTVRLGNQVVGSQVVPKTLGKYVSGQTVPATGKTLDELFYDISTEVVHPSYASPNVTISTSGAPVPGEYEIGSSLNISLTYTYTAPDSNSVISPTYKKGATPTAISTSVAGSTDNISPFITAQSYNVTIQYGNGVVRKNNLGEVDSTGIITAGSVTSGAITFTPKSKKYVGASTTASPTDVELLANTESGFAADKIKNAFDISISAGSKYVFYAYPSSLGSLTSITIGGFESKDAFTLTTKSVTNAQGYSVSYNIYVSNNKFSSTVGNIICK